jgi:catechol 2,3-dioxygenase
MNGARVTSVRGIDLAVRDVDASAKFYKTVWGLDEVGREGGAIYLRATGLEHHVLALHAAPRSGFIGTQLAVASKADVDALHAKALGYGAEVVDRPQELPRQAGGGYGFSFRSPDGFLQNVSSDVARHAGVIADPTRPNKFSHVVMRVANFPQQRGFFIDLLGFKLSDETDGIYFLRCSPDHHSVALAKAMGPGLHHMAFELPNLDSLMYACGRVRSKGYELEWGVGRHSGPGKNIFSFFVEPNGFACEYTTEMDQIDDATYPVRSAQWWRENRPDGGPCAWRMAKQHSPKLLRARTGQLVEELNGTCTEAISHTLAS